MLKVAVTWSAAFFALLAALLWLKASVVKVPPQRTPDASGWIPASYGTSDMDVARTAIAQSRWNAWAAGAAAASAFLSGISLLL